MNLILSVIKSILIVFLSIFCINKVNIFSTLTFIPQEYSFEVYLTLYIAVFEVVFTNVYDKVTRKFYGELSCIFYESKASSDSNPSISFSTGVCFIKCVIEIRGAANLFVKNSIIISLPSWVSAQPMDNSIASSGEDNEFIIPLRNIIPKNEKEIEYTKVNFKVGFILNSQVDNYEIVLTPKIEKERLIRYEFNKINLCSSRRMYSDNN